jgi:hypothetical protein
MQESTKTPTAKVGVPLGVWGFISLTLFCNPGSMKCDSWASFLARTLVNPCVGREPKARVTTMGEVWVEGWGALAFSWGAWKMMVDFAMVTGVASIPGTWQNK